MTYVAAQEIIKNYYEDANKIPETIQKLIKNFKTMSLGVCALGEAYSYLKYLLLDVTTIPILEIHEYSHDGENLDDDSYSNHHSMILDA